MFGAAIAAALFLGGGVMAAPPSQPMTWADLLKRPKPQPTRTVFYGDDPNQFAQLWVPAGRGPHPVVVMIHGGCWQASIANLSLMSYAAEDLCRRGIAVWNIEYRSADQKGGGYPGTYQDVGAAIDRLAIEAPHDHVSMKRVIALGHSAGGQLALWAAARYKLPASSPLHWAAPQPIAGVVDIAGLPNLKTDTDTACGTEVLKEMTGAPTRARPDVYSDTSPAELLPLGVRQIVVHGAQDTTVPLVVSQRYVAAAKASGDSIELRTPPGNHVEEITPGQPAWDAAAQAVQDLLAEASAR